MGVQREMKINICYFVCALSGGILEQWLVARSQFSSITVICFDLSLGEVVCGMKMIEL